MGLTMLTKQQQQQQHAKNAQMQDSKHTTKDEPAQRCTCPFTGAGVRTHDRRYTCPGVSCPLYTNIREEREQM